ncbi:MAG: hypothetical protein ACJ8AW_39695 [Rhodopila sp.]|jgi:hypothetical protein
MKILLLSATLIGAGLVIAGPAIAQPTPDKVDPVPTAQRNDNGSSARDADQGMNRNTTGQSSATKGHSEMGASSAGSTARSTPSMHNDATTGLSSAKKRHEEANTPNK